MATKTDIDTIYKGLNNSQKAALLLIALGQKWATEVMRLLSEDEVRKISFWINQMGYVPQEITEQVIKEFYDKLSRKSSLATMGGKDYLLDVLGGIMSEQQANQMLEELLSQEKHEVFRILKQVDPLQLAAHLKNEQPQTVALMMSHLPAQRAAAIVGALPEEMQLEIVVCLAKLQQSDPEIVSAVEQTLNASLTEAAKVAKQHQDAVKQLGGVKAVAEMLTNIGKTAEKNIMTKLAEKDFDLAAAIKEMMFVFDDIILLDDKSLQKVLKDVEQNDLIISLKGANETVRNKVFKNISKRQAESINDELAFMGPMKGSVVKASQQKIVNLIRKLDEEGQIVIQSKGGGGGDDDVVV
ncbi:MAG: flagellar motor switch protein FliG [Chlamydiales bacterium]|jgi:flagellar motor switch protein FliG|nr:flagellar motor switch protein FliG [Chlamydiales bacterium]